MQGVVTTLKVARMELSRPRLEDIFVRLVAGDADGDANALMSELNAPTEAEAST
jgi:hypothetical protein